VKLIVISPRFPYPLEKGDKLRLYHQLRLLSVSFDIVLISLTDTKIEEKDFNHIKSMVNKVYVFPLKKWRIVFRLLFGIFSTKPFQVLYFFNKRYKKKIKTIIEMENPDIIYNQLIRTAEYSKELKYFKIIDYMDSFSEGMRKRLDNSSFIFKWIYNEEYKRLKRYETEIFNDFDKHSIISNQDRNTFPKGLKDKIEVVANGVDMNYFLPLNKKKIYDIGFVGNMGYRPNIIACEYFVRNIFPDLKKVKPDIKIVFAGARPHPRVKALANDNIFISGWMEDIREAYGQSRIFVAPIFTGIGQQNKILEAMSMELPVITTSAVNRAIGATAGVEIIVADTNMEFVDSILQLLNDNYLAKNLGQSGRNFVQNNYSWDYQSTKLLSLFSKNY